MKTYDFIAIGGLCALNGCNSKKVLVRSSEVLDEVRRPGSFGINTDEIGVDWFGVIDQKETLMRPITAATGQSLKSSGIDVIQGRPTFVGAEAFIWTKQRFPTSGNLLNPWPMLRPASINYPTSANWTAFVLNSNLSG